MTQKHNFERFNLLGVAIDAATNSQAIAAIIDRSAPKEPPGYVIKPYVEFLDRAHRNAQLRELLNNAELALPDGAALTWAAHYLYAGPRTKRRFISTLSSIVLHPERLRSPLPERTAGINFTWPLLEAAAKHKRRVFLIGTEQEQTIKATARFITARLPQIEIAGVVSGRDHTRPRGDVGEAWLQHVLGAVANTHADLILVGTGFPLQERICAHLAANLNHGIFIGEGGTFDYEAFGGKHKKAPAWMQRTGLEWLWRLILQPRRLKRQLAIPRFIWRVWRARQEQK